MEQHYLLTIGDERSASHNIIFVNSFFKNREALKFTLFYVSRAQALGTPMAEDILQQSRLELLSDAEKKNAEAWLEETHDWVVGSGFATGQILSKVTPKRFGTVMDIIQEGHAGLYDAVIVGRRGLSWFEEHMTPSVSRGMLQGNIDFPLWVCRMPDITRRNVLLCADGSGECLRMADHVGYVLAGQPRQQVEIFHVRTHDKDPDAIIESVKSAIIDNGVEERRVSVKVIDATDKASAILKEAYDGGFSVVAVGRHRVRRKGPVERVLFGTISVRLFENVTGFTLWISK